MKALWISVGRNVCNWLSVSDFGIHPHRPTRRPQVFPARSRSQLPDAAAEYGVGAQLAGVINYY